MMEQWKRQNAQAKSLSRILRAETSLPELEKNFKEQKKREQIEMVKKKRPLIRYDWLISYFYEMIKNYGHY